ncbi:MAG: hypothetical protein GC162_20280 [Planctomycetes bacterium]|nr:hypothetical protein [Planctomycetota bacterium]
MKPFAIILIALLTSLASFVPFARAQSVDEWPRMYESDGNVVVLHQPQIESWTKFETIEFSAAVSVQLKGEKEPHMGSLRAAASTKIDNDSRMVLIGSRKLHDIKFPDAGPFQAGKLRDVVEESLPNEKPMTIGLDRVLAYLDGDKAEVPQVEVNLDPPPIFRSEQPAVLMIFLGEPRLEPVKDTGLLTAVNTNWDVFFDPTSGRYFALVDDSWITTDDLTKGPWVPARALPEGLTKLPNTEDWSEVRARVPGQPMAAAPKVFVTHQPSELIVTDGPPAYTPIPGTRLLYVANTDSDLFLNSGDGNHYLLTAGRWFRARTIDGPWTAASRDLPVDFALIPEDSPRGRVLASVPGTAQAQAALILASVPTKATIRRADASVVVVYDGDPTFVVINGSTVRYASNSPYDVFLVDGQYYCCYQGVWFVAGAASGPWVVSTTVPAAIYAIPPTCPKYNVTYVHVYDSTPDTVTCGHTAGYNGQFVACGLLMFGLGYAIADNDDVNIRVSYSYSSCYRASWFSYGCGARYDYYRGGYFQSARVYGPYGGAGRFAAYNPSTGVFHRGAYLYGPRGEAHTRAAYDPFTGIGGRVSGGSNGYGSWGRAYVSNGDDWARAGFRANDRGVIGGAQTGAGGKIAAGRGENGGAIIGTTANDNVYVGKDDNIYRKTDDGWQKYEDGQWASPDRGPKPAANDTKPARPDAKKPVKNTSQGGLLQQLNRDSQSRQLGSQRSNNFESRRSGAPVSAPAGPGERRR